MVAQRGQVQRAADLLTHLEASCSQLGRHKSLGGNQDASALLPPPYSSRDAPGSIHAINFGVQPVPPGAKFGLAGWIHGHSHLVNPSTLN